jgi:ABC-type antimicrobial peptide transport system ATPase subunit
MPNQKFTIALIGNEGSGKTTLANHLISVTPSPDSLNSFRILQHGKTF